MKCAPGSVLCVALFSCAAAQGQDPTDLSALEQTVQKRHGEWESLAKDLSERMARILPCDPRVTTAITEVSRASEARLAAIADYLRAASAKSFAETAAVRNLLNNEEKRTVEAALERSDAGQEQTAVNTQSDALAQSVKQRPALEDAKKVLDQIGTMVRQRAASMEQQAGAGDAALALLRDLAAKFEARDAALREEFAAFEAERARWNGYYAARRTRAQIECTITQIGASPAKGKQ